MIPWFCPTCQFALTLEGAQTYFWFLDCSLSKEKDKQATPLKRLFGECLVPDECRKQRSAHIENTQGNCSWVVCVKSLCIWCREPEQRLARELSGEGSGRGKHTHTGRLFNCRSRTKCTTHVQSGKILQRRRSNNAAMREKSKHVHLRVVGQSPLLCLLFRLVSK